MSPRRWPWQKADSKPLEGLDRADALLRVAKARESDTREAIAHRERIKRENHIARAFGDALHIGRPTA